VLYVQSVHTSTNKMQHPVPNLLLSAKNVHFEIDPFFIPFNDWHDTSSYSRHHSCLIHIKGLLYATHVFAKQYVSETFRFSLRSDQQLSWLNKKCSVVKSKCPLRSSMSILSSGTGTVPGTYASIWYLVPTVRVTWYVPGTWYRSWNGTTYKNICLKWVSGNNIEQSVTETRVVSPHC